MTYLGPVFSFVFMAIIVFAICQYIPALHGKKVLAAIIGIVVAGLMLLSPTAIGMVQYMAPWFAVVIFLLFMMSMLAQSFGGEHGGGMAMGGFGALGGVIIVGILIIGAVNFLRDSALYPDQQSTGTSMKPALIIFNPLVIGALVLIAIAACAMALLTGSGGMMGGGH